MSQNALGIIGVPTGHEYGIPRVKVLGKILSLPRTGLHEAKTGPALADNSLILPIISTIHNIEGILGSFQIVTLAIGSLWWAHQHKKLEA